MSCRRVVFASPTEPSAASWLLNCFLELGIKFYHKPAVTNVWRSGHIDAELDVMWQYRDGRHKLNVKLDMLKKWLPSLYRYEDFIFRPDIEVEYVQDFATPKWNDSAAIYFVRDPRDALYSAYRRIRPELSFDDYLNMPNPYTLLNQVDNWSAHVQSWQQVSGIHFFRFEDYKADAREVLVNVLQALKIDASDTDIDRAVKESSFKKAQQAEQQYHREYPKDDEVANRAGKIGDWKERPEVVAAMRRIEHGTGAVMEELGYQSDYRSTPTVASDVPQKQRLNFFHHILQSPTVTSIVGNVDAERELVDFARRVDAEQLRRSRFSPNDIRTLLDSLKEYFSVSNLEEEQAIITRLDALSEEFTDGSEYHFQRMRELLVQRRANK